MAILQDYVARIKTLLKPFLKPDVLIVAVIIATGAGAFELGRLSVLQPTLGDTTHTPAAVVKSVTSTNTPSVSKAQNPKPQVVSGTYVASKSGSKYYLPSCGGAERIKDENKVWFATKEEAETAGYTPAANCTF